MDLDRDIHLTAVTARSAAALLTPDEVEFTLPARLRWELHRGERTVATGHAGSAALFLGDLEPEAEYELRLPERSAAVRFRTLPCAGIVDAADFGASPERPDNAPALAAAIAATPRGGTLRVPTGRFATGPVFLKSDMSLYLDVDAMLAAVSGREHYPILDARRPDGRMLGSWEGLPAASYASLLTAIDCRNLHVTGPGTIDGGGGAGDWWQWPKETRDGARRPRTIFLNGCEGVTLSGVTVRNSPSWTIHPVYCRNVTVAALRVENPPDSPNTDGLNPECCEDVAIAGVHFSVGDDCIAIKSGKRGPEGEAHLAPTRRVTIRNCRMERGHGAVVIGSEMSGDVTDVDIRRCEFVGTDRGLRIKTRRGRGGEVARIRLSDCRMEGVHTPFAANAFYFCDPDGRSEAVQSRAPAPVDAGTPRVSRIEVSGVRATGVHVALGAFLGLPEAPMTGIRLSGVRADYDPRAVAAPPLMACGVPAMRHAGIFTENAEVETDAAPAMERSKDERDMLMRYFDAYAGRYTPYKGGNWCYEDGCLYRGLAALHDATGDQHWLDHVTRLLGAQIGAGGTLAGFRRADYNIDNIMPGRTLLYLHRKDPGRYLEVAGSLAAQLANHPRTRSGVYWHKLRYPWQVWLDGLYMGLPFQVEYGILTRDRALVEDALAQLETALALTLCPETGLYAHGYDESRDQAWADPETGRSSAHWARALGWLAMALVDVAELVGPEMDEAVAVASVRLFRQLVDLRQPGGLWTQVVDRPDLSGNYVETSASAMFVYALLKARRLGLLELSTSAANDLARTLQDRALRPGRDGVTQMVDICEVAGLGEFKGRYRDGSAAYYLSEPCVADDPKGVGPLMMAVAEALLAGIEVEGVAEETT